MKVNLDLIRRWTPIAELEQYTGIKWLDSRYQEDVPIIGYTKPYYKLFYIISQEMRPAMTVELGSYRGTAAAHFAAGNPDGLVYTVDIHREDKIARQKASEAAARFDNLYYLNGWTWDQWVVDTIRDASRTRQGIDILFIDAWHTYEYAMKEWELYSPYLADEALVICDDIFNAEGATDKMEEFWKQFDYEKFLDPGTLHSGIPMGFMRYVRS